MLSRVAENLYWLGRYMERAEDTARLIQVSRHVMLDFPGTATLGWSSLINITGSDEQFDEDYGKRDEASVLAFLCADKRYGGSILSALAAARENLRTTREVMPREIWEEINQLYHEVNEQASHGIAMRRMDGFLKGVIRGCQTVTGMIIGTLSHTPARTFCGIGCYLERADMTTRTLDVRSANLLPRSPGDLTPFENLQWMGCSSRCRPTRCIASRCATGYADRTWWPSSSRTRCFPARSIAASWTCTATCMACPGTMRPAQW